MVQANTSDIMKKARKATSLFLTILTVLMMISCEPELDLDSEEITNSLPGIWICQESQLKQAYEVRLVKSTIRSNSLIVYNFYNLGERAQVEIRVDGYELDLFQQTFSDDYTTKGSAYMNDDLDEIQWSYEVDDGTGLIEQYNAIYTKQN